MRATDIVRRHSMMATSDDNTPRHPARTERALRPQLITDAVIAAYIHDISVRHRRRGATRRLAESHHAEA
jgi:hypothetical protein